MEQWKYQAETAVLTLDFGTFHRKQVQSVGIPEKEWATFQPAVPASNEIKLL